MVSSLTDLAAGSAYSLQRQGARLSALMQTQASGQRITRAMDDIASLSAATGLSRETSGLRVAAQNINQASSFLQVAEGGMSQMQMILDRLSELATQANSGALDANTRQTLDSAFQQQLSELNRLAETTSFNDVLLLDGSLSSQQQALRAPENIGPGDTQLRGQISDALIAGSSGSAASSLLAFTGLADISAGSLISIDDGAGGILDFEFVSGAAANNRQIEMGATLEATLENAARVLNNYEGAGDFGLSQLEVSISGDALRFETAFNGNALAQDALTPIGLSTTTNGRLSNAALDNGNSGGVDLNNITASDFTGRIEGFRAEFQAQNQLVAEVTVGSQTYRGEISDTNAAAEQTVTFRSAEGGSFDVTFSGGQGVAVGSQQEAEQFASRLDAAFRSLEVTQTREVPGFGAGGLLSGARLAVQAETTGIAAFQNASVRDNRLEIEVNGAVYRSEVLGEAVGAAERLTLTTDDGRELTFINGDNRFDISASAQTFTQALMAGFGTADGGAAFQVSSDAQGTLRLGIGNMTTQGLGLEGINLLTASGASEAFNAVGVAIQTLSSQRADVGAFQQALDYAAGNVESALQNQEAARSTLFDADIAGVSTELSLLEAAQQAAISTQAQTNRLQGNLLKLIQ